jgi:SAM-dependent methyltransferase
VAVNTLGHRFFGDSTYHLEFTFPHTEDKLALEFASDLFEGEGTEDESWGLDDIKVTVEPRSHPKPRKSVIMGLYSRWIFPRLCDWAMSSPEIARLRKEVLADVGEEVLEIGFGTGLNLEHYPERVRRIAAVDPAEGMARMARKRIAGTRIEVDATFRSAEELSFKDESFDYVVSTFTLCSIPDVPKALEEVYRVLKPGGRFLFLEHGLSDDTKIRRWQRRLNPIQRRLAGGCRLDLDVEAILRGQPFESVSVDRFALERTPRTHGTMFRGAAVR